MTDKGNRGAGSAYQHAEAFCLMKYASRNGRMVEWLWNSRDGVTPFIISSPTGIELMHMDFRGDRCVPDHKPEPGERIFVTATEELVRDKVIERVEYQWEQGLKDYFPDKEAAIRNFIDEWTNKGSPWIVTVKEPTP